MVVVQGDYLNRSGLNTAVCVSLTTNLRLAAAHGNVLLPAEVTQLPQDSVANVSQVQAVDLSRFDQHVSTLPRSYLLAVLSGIDVMLGR
jgi:mRNA interferase MazF